MIKPLRSKNNKYFIACIFDITLLYYLFLFEFLKRIIFPLKLFYILLTVLNNTVLLLEEYLKFSYLIITSIWSKFRLRILYNRLFQKALVFDWKYDRDLIYKKNFLKKKFFSALLIKPTKLNYLFSSRSKGYSKITETCFISKKKNNNLQMESKIFLNKTFLKEELLLKNSSIDVYINKNSFPVMVTKDLYSLLKFLVPLIGVGVIKKNLINITRPYYLKAFDNNLRNLILLYMNETIILKPLKSGVKNEQGFRKKERLKKFKIYKRLVNTHRILYTLLQHSVYTIIFLISIIIYLNALDIYLDLRY